MMHVQELAAKAANLIEVRGWTRGDYEDNEGRLSLPGAVNEVLSGDPADSLTYTSEVPPEIADDLYDAVRTRSGYGPHEWNDAPGRTKGEVVALLRSIAAGE